jgi:hypothetical protein
MAPGANSAPAAVNASDGKPTAADTANAPAKADTAKKPSSAKPAKVHPFEGAKPATRNTAAKAKAAKIKAAEIKQKKRAEAKRAALNLGKQKSAPKPRPVADAGQGQ